MGTQLKICSEADYLQAHLTIIAERSDLRNPRSRNAKHRITSILKKWIKAAKAGLSARPAPAQARKNDGPGSFRPSRDLAGIPSGKAFMRKAVCADRRSFWR